MPEYISLAHEADAESADLNVLSVYEMANRGRAGLGSTLPEAYFRPQDMRASLSSLMQDEINIFRVAKMDIDGLLAECFANIGASLRV